MPGIQSLNPFSISESPRLEGETSTAPSAPELEEMEGVAAPQTQPEQKKFEWNVERLFVRNPEHSEARTWFARILGLIVGIPTLILDLGRRIAFSLGLVNGKSYSLIDIASNSCKTLADKVNGLLAPKELTLEEENDVAKTRIEKHVEKLIDGYRKLNGGSFHTNSSFSSPHALKAEAQIRKAKIDLINEVNDYAARNTQSPEEFAAHVSQAKAMIQEAINRVAGEEFYIDNKVERRGEPDMLRDIAFDEFLDAFEVGSPKLLANSFVQAANREQNVVAGLQKGVESGVLTRAQAHEALQTQAVSLYSQGLVTGIEEAEKSVKELFDQAIEEKLVTSQEAQGLNEQIHPEVEVLATAAARDVARANLSEERVPNELIHVAHALQYRKRLTPEDVSQFLTSAEQKIAQARKEVEAEKARVQAEAELAEAERVAEVQKAHDQQSLFNQFTGMLSLIEQKQKELTTRFLNFDQLEVDLSETAEQLESIRNAKVTIRGQETTVLQAAGEYASALSHIARSNLTAMQRKEQMNALANEGFTKGTIDKIAELKNLEPRLTQIIDAQANLAREIETQHDQLARLRGVYAVFRKNHFDGLEVDNRKAVIGREVQIVQTQKTLNDRHSQIVGRTGVIARMRLDQPSIPVNIDPQANREEVGRLVSSYEQELRRNDVIVLPKRRAWYERLRDNVTAPIRWIRG